MGDQTSIFSIVIEHRDFSFGRTEAGADTRASRLIKLNQIWRGLQRFLNIIQNRSNEGWRIMDIN
mgnify:CR=1 FL=1